MPKLTKISIRDGQTDRRAEPIYKKRFALKISLNEFVSMCVFLTSLIWYGLYTSPTSMFKVEEKRKGLKKNINVSFTVTHRQ